MGKYVSKARVLTAAAGIGGALLASATLGQAGPASASTPVLGVKTPDGRVIQVGGVVAQLERRDNGCFASTPVAVKPDVSPTRPHTVAHLQLDKDCRLVVTAIESMPAATHSGPPTDAGGQTTSKRRQP